MASAAKFSYQKLRNEGDDYKQSERFITWRTRSWGSRFRKVPIKKRFKLRIPSLKRFFKRKSRLLSAVRISWVRIFKRLRESESHFGDLFAGNYLFLQVGPTPLKRDGKSLKGHDLGGLSSRYSVPRITN